MESPRKGWREKGTHRGDGTSARRQPGTGPDVAVNIEEHGCRKVSSGLQARIFDSGINRSDTHRSGGRGYAARLRAMGVDSVAHGAARGRGWDRRRRRRHGLLDDGRGTGQAALELGETRLQEDPFDGCRWRVRDDAIFAQATDSSAQAACGEALIASPLQFLAGTAGLIAARLHLGRPRREAQGGGGGVRGGGGGVRGGGGRRWPDLAVRAASSPLRVSGRFPQLWQVTIGPTWVLKDRGEREWATWLRRFSCGETGNVMRETRPHTPPSVFGIPGGHRQTGGRSPKHNRRNSSACVDPPTCSRTGPEEAEVSSEHPARSSASSATAFGSLQTSWAPEEV